MHALCLQPVKTDFATPLSSARHNLLSALRIHQPGPSPTRLGLDADCGAAQVWHHQHRPPLTLVVHLAGYHRFRSARRLPAGVPQHLDPFDFDAGEHEMAGALRDQ